MSGPTDRLQQLWDHLGLTEAHIATQMAGDIAGFVHAAPQRLAGVVLCVPARLDPAPFGPIASRVTLISAERGLTATVTANAQSRLSGAARQC